jgi:hypothetical protein
MRYFVLFNLICHTALIGIGHNLCNSERHKIYYCKVKLALDISNRIL